MKSIEEIIREHGPIIWANENYLVSYDEKLDIKIFAYGLEYNSDFLDIDFSMYDNLRDLGQDALEQFQEKKKEERKNYGSESS